MLIQGKRIIIHSQVRQKGHRRMSPNKERKMRPLTEKRVWFAC